VAVVDVIFQCCVLGSGDFIGFLCINRIVMRRDKKIKRSAGALATIIGLLASSFMPVMGQDLVATSSISGSSSVFVFRKTTTQKRFTSTAKVTKTKTQRTETSKRIRTQYSAQASAKPHRERSTVVAPTELPSNIKTMSKTEAARLLSGVGEYYLDRNDLEDSIAAFRDASNLDPRNVKAKFGLSDALATKASGLADKDHGAAAKNFYLESLKYNPKNAEALFGLGDIYSDQDQNKEAIASYEKALAADPGLTEIYDPLGTLYYQNGDIAKADQLLTKALVAAPNSANTQLLVGSIRLAQNRNADALTAFQKAKSLDPNSAEAANGLGDVYTRMDRTKDAVNEYRRAVQLKANYLEAWRSLGAAYLEQENYNDAINAYQQAFRLKNDDADTAEGLADAQRLAGKYNDAAGSYRLAQLFMSRSNAYSKDQQADVSSKLGYVIGRQCEINLKNYVRCEWPSAISALEKAAQLSGTPADNANLGWAYYNAAMEDTYAKRTAEAKAKTELARAALEKAVAANPSFIEGPLLNLGMVRTDLGDYAGAVSALTRAVQKQPKWAFAWNELGIAYRKQDKYSDAVEQFKKAVDVDPNLASAWYNMGESAIRSNDMSTARKAYQKLIKMGQKNFAGQLELMSRGAVKK